MDIVKKTVMGAVAGAVLGLMQLSISTIRNSSKRSKIVSQFNKNYPYVQQHSDLNYCLQQLQDYAMYDRDGSFDKLFEFCNQLIHVYEEFRQNKDQVSSKQIILMSHKVFQNGRQVKQAVEDVQTQILMGRPQDHKTLAETVQLVQKIADDVWFNTYMECQTLI